MEIRWLAHYGGVVQLEVAGVEDVADGGSDGQAGGVRDAMGDAHILHLELPQVDGSSRLDQAQVGVLEEPVLLELDGDQAMREAGTVDGRALAFGQAELGEDVGKGAGVVLVPVGDDDAAQLLDAVGHVGDVGDHQVHPQHLLLGEHKAGIDDDEVFAQFEDHHVLADLP